MNRDRGKNPKNLTDGLGEKAGKIERITTTSAAGAAFGAGAGVAVDVLIGGSLGTILPGAGTVAGAVVGGVVGAVWKARGDSISPSSGFAKKNGSNRYENNSPNPPQPKRMRVHAKHMRMSARVKRSH